MNNLSESDITSKRWGMIMPAGFVGQQSFVSINDLSGQFRRLASAHRCLDIGCGQGRILVYLLKKFKRLSGIGIDISKNAVERARSWASDSGVGERCEFRISDAARVDDETLRSVDSLIALDSIQSVQRPTELLARIARRSSGFSTYYISLWAAAASSDGWGVASMWNFSQSVPVDTLSTVWRQSGGSAASIKDTTDTFMYRCERSLESLVQVRTEYVSLYGERAFVERKNLEEATVGAVKTGSLKHITIQAI